MKKIQLIVLLYFATSFNIIFAQNPIITSNAGTTIQIRKLFKIDVEIKKELRLGFVATFKSNIGISKLIITSDDTSILTHIYPFKEKTKTFKINLDSPAFVGHTNYIFNYYVKRKSEPFLESKPNFKTKPNFKNDPVPENILIWQTIIVRKN